MSRALRLRAGGPVARFAGVRHGDDSPFQHVTAHLPEAIGRRLVEEDLSSTSVIAAVERHLGIAPAYVEQTVEVTRCARLAAELLEAPAGAPILRFRRTYFTGTGEPNRARGHLPLDAALSLHDGAVPLRSELAAGPPGESSAPMTAAAVPPARPGPRTFIPGHRLNSGAFGCMGIGLPFGLGAKVAKPDTQVIVLHGDGSYGINAMEIDTAVRHKIPVVVVISNNGGWTADAPWGRPEPKPGRNLGFTRYDEVAMDFGAHGEFVEKANDIRPALERAAASGKPAVVNVITDPKARAQTVRFSAYQT